MTDAEVVTLCVAQSIMGIASDRRFIAVARRRLEHLFPMLPDRDGFYKRREALSDVIEALIAEFASHSRYFYGLGLHTLFAMDGTPRAFALTSPKIDERTSACNWSRAAPASPASS